MLSIVVPCHNEEGNIPLIVERFLALHKQELFELILVNNASTDGTRRAMDEARAFPGNEFIRIVDEPTPGYGRAIMTGLKAATGEVLAWTHGDIQTDPADVLAAFEQYKKGKGRRVVRGVRVSSRPLLDRIFTRGMELVATRILGQKLREINAQPKVFGREFLGLLINPPTDFSFDLYWLSTAVAAGYAIEDVSVRFAERQHGESKSAATLQKKIKTSKSILRFMWQLRMMRIGNTERAARKRTWLAFSGLFIAFFLAGAAIIQSGYTVQVVDQIYCRNFLPWAAHAPEGITCQYRSGDDLFESDAIAEELHYLSANPYQQSYSERIMNGYPIVDAYAATPFTPHSFFRGFLSAPDAATMTALLFLFVSIALGFGIARMLGFSRPLAWVFGILSATPAYVGIASAWNMALLGLGFVAAGALRFLKRSDTVGFILLSFLGVTLLLLSSVYQLYLYAMISFLFLLAGVWKSAPGRRFWIFVGGYAVAGAVSVLLLNRELISHLSFLISSNKWGNMVAPDAYFFKKGLAMDPLGWFGVDLVVFHRILLARFVPPHIFSFFQPIQAGVYSPGPVYIFFAILGLAEIWRRSRAYAGFLLFWFLYFAGPLQLLLSYTVRGPFLTETSVRASYLVFLFGTVAVMHGFIAYQVRRGRLMRVFRYAALVGFLYLGAVSLLLSMKGMAQGENMREPIFVFISIVLFVIGSRLIRQEVKDPSWWAKAGQIVLGTALVLPTVGRLFLGANPAVFSLKSSAWYYPATPFTEAVRRAEDLGRVILLGAGEGAMHPTFPNRMGLATVTGYRNPLVKSYLELFAYYRLRIEGHTDAPEAFQEFLSGPAYLDNAYLREITIPTTTFAFDPHDEAFFDMAGIRSVIAMDDMSIRRGDWERVVSADALSLWRRSKAPPEFIFVTSTITIIDPVKRMRYLVEENTPEMLRSRAVVAETLDPLVVSASATTSITGFFQADGYREMIIHSDGGLLVIPATFSPKWSATLTRAHGVEEPLRTLEANGAFFGIIVPPESEGKIIAHYVSR